METLPEEFVPTPAADPVTPHPAADNIATAQHLYEVIGQDLAVVGAWLHATAAGAFKDVEEAIEHILGNVPKV